MRFCKGLRVALVPPLRRAKGARLDALLDLHQDLIEARRLIAHPLNARLVAEHLLMAYARAVQGGAG